MIKFQNVTKTYHLSDCHSLTAVENISFEIFPKEFLTIIGKSGAGKTTLIKLLLGEEKLTNGEIYFDEIKISEIEQNHLQKIRRKIGVVYQDYRLFPSKTVFENVSYILEVIGEPEDKIKKEIPQVLELVGLEHLANHFPYEISGGEQQRLAIARALIHRPEVIIADEPTGNLDVYNAAEVVNLLKKINSLGTTLILATHNKETVENLKTRVITLSEGKLIRDDLNGNFIL